MFIATRLSTFEPTCLKSTLFALMVILLCALPVQAGRLTLQVQDKATGKAIPGRVYIQSIEKQSWHFLRSGPPNGSALKYTEQWVPMRDAVEKHTTISAHSCIADLTPGKYQITVERGKEYLPHQETIEITDEPFHLTVKLSRWINMANRRWYSGETHVHRRPFELPNIMLAEDLNVAFPVIYWTVKAGEAPGTAPSPLRRQGPSPHGHRKDPGKPVVRIDDTHIYFPRNTEYEIFSIGEKRHVLGALFILNHKSIFKTGMPPVRAIAEQAHREGALLDLDKHSWPWSMILIPTAKIDLFELSNNSVWRTNFGFKRTSVALPAHASIERDGPNMTEMGWLHFGFENYYTLLNCGFRLSPTAGTASGVHPVPLGYSRVYVEQPSGFSPESWLKGLKQGRSFVTTGPMLFASVNNRPPGSSQPLSKQNQDVMIECEIISERRINAVEVIVNGEKKLTIPLKQSKQPQGGFAGKAQATLPIAKRDSSRWIALRCFQEQSDGRFRFAHTGPFYVTVDGQPIRPRNVDVDYLVNRTRKEIERSLNLLPEEAKAEYRAALTKFESLRKLIRD